MSQTSSTPAGAVPAVDEWSAGPYRFPTRKRLVVVELLLLPALPIALVGFLLWGFAGLALGFVAAALGLLLWALVLRPPFRTLRPRPMRPDEGDRIRNLVEGLSKDLGHASPSLLVIESDDPNAYVARRLGSESIALTSGLLATYTRTEQEAVAAHCVARLRSAPLGYSMMAAAAGRWAFAHAPSVGIAEDLAAVAITRYPPALSAAIDKAATKLEEAPLAFSSGAGCHLAASARRSALSDL